MTKLKEEKFKKESIKKLEEIDILRIKRFMMAKKKNKTIWGVIGVLLTVFGVMGTIPSLLNKDYLLGLPVTAMAVIVGIILMAWAFSD